MTIYFDENKKAYGYEIENPTCQVEDDFWSNYAGKNNWDIIDGVFTDISQTPEYLENIAEQEKQAQISDLTSQIEVLDLKRIRALAEGGNYDDNITWLEYYTQQIISLRNQLISLEN